MRASAFRYFRSQRELLVFPWSSDWTWRSALLCRLGMALPIPGTLSSGLQSMPTTCSNASGAVHSGIASFPSSGHTETPLGRGLPQAQRREARAMGSVCQAHGMPAVCLGSEGTAQGRLRAARGSAQRHFSVVPSGLNAPPAPGPGEDVAQRQCDPHAGTTTTPGTMEPLPQSLAHSHSEALPPGTSPTVREPQSSHGPCDPLPSGAWAGLEPWRRGGVRTDWRWGEAGPTPVRPQSTAGSQVGSAPGQEEAECVSRQRERHRDVEGAREGQADSSRGRLREQTRDSGVALDKLSLEEYGWDWDRDGGSGAGNPPTVSSSSAPASAPTVSSSSAPASAPTVSTLGVGPQEMTLVGLGRAVFGTPCVDRKVRLTHLAMALWERGELPIGSLEEGQPLAPPALPEKPELVHPRAVPKPGKKSPLPLSAHLIHTLAHVELNAVHLAWDTAVRFAPQASVLGRHFFGDFLRVADDEARHFGWCQQRLRELGFWYGDMPAHNLLWVDCQKSQRRVEHRLAIIPMVQEARGLDAGPRLVERLVGAGDSRSAAVVKQICDEEMAHVAVGVAWFSFVCARLGVEPYEAFSCITKELFADGVKGPFNHEARALAGLPRFWYDRSDMEGGPCGLAPGVAPGSLRSGQGEPLTDSKGLELHQVQKRLAALLALEDSVH